MTLCSVLQTITALEVKLRVGVRSLEEVHHTSFVLGASGSRLQSVLQLSEGWTKNKNKEKKKSLGSATSTYGDTFIMRH